MSVLSPEQVEPGIDAAIPSEQRKTAIKPRSVQPCNFRSAGHLSNENARTLTAIHETFARHLAGTLSAYIRTDVKVKILSLNQTSVKDHTEAVAAFGYIANFSLSSGNSVSVECNSDLVFPMIDLLLGGRDISQLETRDLSEIEDEIMLDLVLVVARQAEVAWGIPGISVTSGNKIDLETLRAICPANEKLVVVKFEIEVAEVTGTFQVVFPASVAGLLIKQSKQGHPQRKGALRFFPATSLRERILDCDVVVAADLPSMKVSVRDLITLQPGYVLKLRAPVRAPGVLTVEGRQIFEAVPVRNGAQKAAQVGRRVQLTSWGKE